VIAFIEGIVRQIKDSSVYIASAGLGYEVLVPRSTLEKCKEGESVFLQTKLIVREDAWTLYGFHHADQQQLFEILLSVTGVGPKVALALLSQLQTPILAGAILDGDTGLLSSVTGVGKKTAERMVLELRTKIPEHLRAGAKGEGGKRVLTPRNPHEMDAVDALIALGYRDSSVRQVVSELLQASPEATTDQLIRKSLGKLR
jgi:holliday junction DNA helicase RuvA